jgi:hypothetical protein
LSIDGKQLQQRVLAFIAQPADDDFERLALAVFAFQYEQNAIYRAYCERRQLTPATVMQWRQIPSVPTSAFKDFALTCFPADEAVAVFHTSGTTRDRAGKHYFKTLDLYDAAISPNFTAHLLPDDAHLPALILAPSPTEAPHSSLSHMMEVVSGPDSEYFVEHDTLFLERLTQRLCEMQWASQPVLLLGTAFAFVHLFDHFKKTQTVFRLAAGSRAMETGGFKGRSREVSKPDLYRLFQQHLGLPPHRVVNEYGMTELSTQFYDESLRLGRQSDLKVIPHWARVLVIDPQSGAESPPGERGLIRIFDLANIWSIICLQTEDFGRMQGEGRFEVLGRAANVEVRGCSLNAESLAKQ